MEKENIVNNIKRITPNPTVGLSYTAVENRKVAGLTNKSNKAVGKTYGEIIRTNVLSFFNILLFCIAALMIFGGYYDGLFFLIVLIPNIGIGLYEDIHANRLLSKLNLLTSPVSRVVRDGSVTMINNEEIVLDDVVLLEHGDQISVDGVVLSGSITVNESALTGESVNIFKNPGDRVYSGSFVAGGRAYIHADKVGKDCYVNQLHEKANQFKRSPSRILNSLRHLFRTIGIIVIIIAACTFTIYGVQGKMSTIKEFKEIIPSISGSMVGMIPSGLYLLTSAALAVAVASLAKKNARVQDFYSVEMLARVDVLCVDKTGTITDGTLKVRNIDVINTSYTAHDIGQIISNIVYATGDSNSTATALKTYFDFEKTSNAQIALPFNSENKYSAATFMDKTYVLGAAEFLPLTMREGIIRRSYDYTSQGYRVLVLAETPSPITNNQVTGPVNALAFIVIEDKVKKSAIDTFAWFKENNVQIKVISGDNAITVSKIAEQAGIENTDKYISLEGKTDEEVADLADEYTVFGRVSPEQKEIIVKTLRKRFKKNVAMTGDGVNDVLALKRADCSIAMANGSDAAKNVSHIVLMDSDFNSLPKVVAEGRRVINNLQRTCSLFLVKTIFSIVLSVTFLIMSLSVKEATISYPFVTNHLYLWEIFGIGIAAFFLALQPNSEKIKGGFMANIFRKAIPGGVTVVLATLAIFILWLLQFKGVFYFGIKSFEEATSMAVLVFTLVSLAILYRVCVPLDLYRGVVFGSVCLVDVGALIWSYFKVVATDVESSLLKIDFNILNGENYLVISIASFLAVGLYLTLTRLFHILKEGKDYDD